jgi:hypothetical protein
MDITGGESDPVVRELPVYLSLELAHRLYLLQYPLRAGGRSVGEGAGNPVSPTPPHHWAINQANPSPLTASTLDCPTQPVSIALAL